MKRGGPKKNFGKLFLEAEKNKKKERQVWPERTFLKELFLKQKKRLDKQHGLGRSRASEPPSWSGCCEISEKSDFAMEEVEKSRLGAVSIHQSNCLE